MKTSLMMVFVCNPHIAIIQKKLYLKYWKDEVDEVLINVNGRNDTVRKFIIDYWKDDDKVAYIDEVPSEIRQGPAFDRIYPHATGDIIITMDSDNLICRKNIIKYFTNLMETQYDSIGSIGYHAYPNCVSKVAIERYGTVRLSPFMSFFKKKIIDKIPKLTFGTYNYEKGEKFPPLGEICAEGWMDVMAKFSLEYLHISGAYLKIPESKERDYVHIGALSSIMRRNFRELEDTNTQKYTRKTSRFQHPRYLTWYYIIYHMTKDEVDIPGYNEEFERGFWEEATRSKMTLEQINILKADLLKKYPINL